MDRLIKFGILAALIYTTVAMLIYKHDKVLDAQLLQAEPSINISRQTANSAAMEENQIRTTNALPTWTPDKHVSVYDRLASLQQVELQARTEANRLQDQVETSPSAEDFKDNAFIYGFCAAALYASALLAWSLWPKPASGSA